MDNFHVLTGEESSAEQRQAIKDLVERRLKHLLDEPYIPNELRYIVDEVCIARYNMIGSEGLSSHSVEGEAQSWADDLFAPYMGDISAWKERHGSGMRVKFL